MDRPLRKIVFNPETDKGKFGMFAISEVLDPAIEENWVFFENQKETDLNLSIQNEEQRIVFGAILIPGMKIYRNGKHGEYDLTIDKKTIEAVVVDFFENKRTDHVVQDHKNEIVEGFTFFQSVITNDLIPTVKGFEHLPKGTAFLGAKVTSDEKWEEIKAGKFKGWSIHSIFNQENIELSKEDEDLSRFVDKLLNLIK